ncbi:MAG TPA: CBASS cGAMP-activated phospholipase [Smithellaceae bacterium]|nr:CBASS cGAMP-activated phospholipase [Smithellaceae bacterium]
MTLLNNPQLETGVRIWLSGSIPDSPKCSRQQKESIQQFVANFSESIFRAGGHILHGSHPNISPVLLDQAKKYQDAGGKKDCLTLCVSRYFSKNREIAPVDEWRKVCTVYETPEASGLNARDDSLAILRKWMAARCDAIVVVGGKIWEEIAGRAGIPLEINYAVERGVPCFLLGSLGGATEDYFLQHPEVLAKLRNGFDEATNRALATEENIDQLVKTICEQLGRLPLVRGRGSDGISFRILALDGGGIKGTFTASALATWEEQTGLRIVDHFDLVAGTSTGGIIAIGLGIGLTGKEMLQFYRDRGPLIFPVTSLYSRLWYILRHIFRPKYSQEVLLREIETAYYGGKGSIPLERSLCRLLIPAYHAIAGESHVFRTPHHALLNGDAKVQAAHVALATAAAPTFFSAAKVGNMIAESSYFDGGVWANSPAMAAIIEAVCYLGVPLDRIDVLSVGTTEEPFSVRKQTCAGILRWNIKLIRLLMSAQEESSIKHAHLLAGSPRFLRVNVMTPAGSYCLDNPKEISELADLGNREALKPEILGQVRSRFLNGVSVNQWEHY